MFDYMNFNTTRKTNFRKREFVEDNRQEYE